MPDPIDEVLSSVSPACSESKFDQETYRVNGTM
jgi:hypothetical protein